MQRLFYQAQLMYSKADLSLSNLARLANLARLSRLGSLGLKCSLWSQPGNLDPGWAAVQRLQSRGSNLDLNLHTQRPGGGAKLKK